MQLDGETSVAGVQWDLSLQQETYIGFGPETHMKCKCVFNHKRLKNRAFKDLHLRDYREVYV